MLSLRRSLFALIWYALLLLALVNCIYALNCEAPLSFEKAFRLEGFRERAETIVQGIVGRPKTKGTCDASDGPAQSRAEKKGRKEVSRWAIPPMREKPREYHRLLRWASKTYGVEKPLIGAILRAESSGNPWARSHEGAVGLMQLMPSTARRYLSFRDVKELYRPATNVSIGTSHLAWLKRRIRARFPRTRDNLKRQVQLIAGAYNAGLEAVLRHSGVPPYPETEGYVRRVWRLYRRLSPSRST